MPIGVTGIWMEWVIMGGFFDILTGCGDRGLVYASGRGAFLTVINIFSRRGRIKPVKFSSVWRGFQIW
jgi:hypothetical protein